MPIGIPEPDVQNSVQLKMKSVILHGYGKVKEEPYQCIHCHPARTQASQNRTLINVERYMAIIENIQLIQGFYQNSSQPCNWKENS